MKPVIIGIGGHKGSGKDLVASIFNYITYKGEFNATYHDWSIDKQSYDLLLKPKILHFADVVKNNLSDIFSINRDLFDNRKYKDELWYDIRRNEFIEQEWLTNEHKKLYIDDFKETDSFKKLIANNPEFPCLKLRTLMQVYGQLMRDTFGDDIWVNSTIKKANNIALANNFSIISDVRYTNEAMAIKSNHPSTGYVVRIFRDSIDKYINDNHPSEQITYVSDYNIYNNSNIVNLFYQCFEIYKQINK